MVQQQVAEVHHGAGGVELRRPAAARHPRKVHGGHNIHPVSASCARPPGRHAHANRSPVAAGSWSPSQQVGSDLGRIIALPAQPLLQQEGCVGSRHLTTLLRQDAVAHQGTPVAALVHAPVGSGVGGLAQDEQAAGTRHSTLSCTQAPGFSLPCVCVRPPPHPTNRSPMLHLRACLRCLGHDDRSAMNCHSSFCDSSQLGGTPAGRRPSVCARRSAVPLTLQQQQQQQQQVDNLECTPAWLTVVPPGGPCCRSRAMA